MLFASIIIILIGAWLLISHPKINHPAFGNPTMIIIIGIYSIVFFGFVVFTLLKNTL